MNDIKYLKLPLRIEESQGEWGLGGCSIEYYIRDAMNHCLAKVYAKEVGEEIVWACNQQIK